MPLKEVGFKVHVYAYPVVEVSVGMCQVYEALQVSPTCLYHFAGMCQFPNE